MPSIKVLVNDLSIRVSENHDLKFSKEKRFKV